MKKDSRHKLLFKRVGGIILHFHIYISQYTVQCNFQFFYFLLMMIGIKIQFIL